MQRLMQVIAIMISGEWKIITLHMNWWTCILGRQYRTSITETCFIQQS